MPFANVTTHFYIYTYYQRLERLYILVRYYNIKWGGKRYIYDGIYGCAATHQSIVHIFAIKKQSMEVCIW